MILFSKQTTERNNVDSILDLLSDKFDIPNLNFKDFDSILNLVLALPLI